MTAWLWDLAAPCVFPSLAVLAILAAVRMDRWRPWVIPTLPPRTRSPEAIADIVCAEFERDGKAIWVDPLDGRMWVTVTLDSTVWGHRLAVRLAGGSPMFVPDLDGARVVIADQVRQLRG